MKRINTTAKPEKINEVVAFAHNGNTEIVETLDFRDGVRYALEFVKETSAERDRLKEELKEVTNSRDYFKERVRLDEIAITLLNDKKESLQAINSELLEALKAANSLINQHFGLNDNDEGGNEIHDQIKQAIAKATKP